MLIPRVLVLATGGTIASRRSGHGPAVAIDTADDLLARFHLAGNSLNGVTLDAQDIMLVGSYLLEPEDMLEIARRVHQGLRSEDVVGVVVTHGTDTMEETAYLLDLVHDDARPVVFTGAQRPADAPDTDGPRNLADAVTVASHESARGLGALIVFDGQVFAAARTRKTNTLAPAAFSSTISGPIGYVRQGSFVLTGVPRRPTPLDLNCMSLTGVRVDIVPFYPGADTVALRAVEAAGATGVVVEAVGAGNVNPRFCGDVARLTAAGMVVAFSTRVAAGPVTAIYGAGGGRDLLDAGAVLIATLRPPQARILLSALLARFHDPDRVRQELCRRPT